MNWRHASVILSKFQLRARLAVWNINKNGEHKETYKDNENFSSKNPMQKKGERKNRKLKNFVTSAHRS